MTLVILIAILVAVVIAIIGMYNRIVAEERQVKTAESNAQVVIDRRFKSLQSIIEVMKKHNADLISGVEKIIAMRTNGTLSEQEEIQNKAVREINLLVERYPELGQVYNSNEFSTQIYALDRDVEMAKKLYNQEVEEFNILINSIPYNLLKGSRRDFELWKTEDVGTKSEYTVTFE